MRKTIIAASLSIVVLGMAGIAAFAQTSNTPANGQAGMDGMAPGGAMPMPGMAMMSMMQGMMPMMQGMMPMMMGMMPMKMPLAGQPMAGPGGMANTAAAPPAVPADLEQKLDLLIKNIDSLTARIQKLEAPAAN